MKRLLLPLLALIALTAAAGAQAQTATITWSAVSSTSTGTALPAGTAVSYNIYAGPQGTTLAKIQSSVAGLTATQTLTGLAGGSVYCVAVTAIATGYTESAQSPSACAAVPLPSLGAPPQITIVIH